MQDTNAYIVGISGISSSGKTTLARYLRKLFTDLTIPEVESSSSHASTGKNTPVGKITFNVSLLHEDDFFFPESTLPVRKVALKHKDDEPEETVDMVDWDFPGAIDFGAFKKALRFLHQGVPYADVLKDIGIMETEGSEATEPEQAAEAPEKGGKIVSEDVLKELRQQIVSQFNAVTETPTSPLRGTCQINLVIVDGFMLFHRDEDEAKPTTPPLVSLLDLKLLLRVPYALAKERRESRNGYITTDGFWTDPEGYFDGIVWPNYVRYHRHLFAGGDVEMEDLTEEWGPSGRGVELQPETLAGMEGLLRWASERLAEGILRSTIFRSG